MLAALKAPVINDIASDLDNPPQFAQAKQGDLPSSFKGQIRKAYPDLQPLVMRGASQRQAYDWALSLAQRQPRWQLTMTDAHNGIIEGVAATRVIGFKDDFVIRILPLGSDGAKVDMRSRSRVGKGDLGANAARIRSFLAQLSAAKRGAEGRANL